MTDLVSQATSKDFAARAIVPARELGAYEALWLAEGSTFKSIAHKFRSHPDSVPSDFVSPAEAQKYARIALGAIREASIRHFGIRIHGAGEYPVKLRDAQHPVELLYFQGNWDLASTASVAVVGTRNPSDEGRRRTAKLSRMLVEYGYTVVSGLAQGVDTEAHTAAIDAGGSTIAVIGTPITSCYPRENLQLQKRIADKFLLVSQVPIIRYSRQTSKWNRLFFPERNVTMSALTEATIIVEAGNTSGTLIQARHALRQGRKLFILDNCFRNPSLTWPQYYQNRGAIRITDFEEIKSHLEFNAPHKDRRD